VVHRLLGKEKGHSFVCGLCFRRYRATLPGSVGEEKLEEEFMEQMTANYVANLSDMFVFIHPMKTL
jgi:hypothetical protein